jgi:hypothetical protein
MWNSKPKKRGHDCRGRTHGNPKIGAGICHLGVRPSIGERIRGRHLARRWLAAARVGAIDDVDE